MSKRLRAVATLGPVGFVRASGTVATALTLPIAYAVAQFSLSFMGQMIVVVGVAIVSLVACSRILVHEELADPSYVVIDEVLGCLVTFCGMPAQMWVFVVGFFLFRFFDISKWCGVSYFERLPGAWGVVADDVAAGVLSNFILLLCVRYVG